MSPANLLFVPEELSAYQWRPARREDIPAVYVMRAAGVAVDRPHTPPSEERLGHLFGLLGEHLEQNTLLALAEDDAVAAAAFVFFPPPEDAHLALVDGHVHVRLRGRGLGSYLLSWLEARARQEFSGGEDSLPQLLRTSCAAHQSDRIALFEQHGFQAARYSYTMQRGLVEPVPEIPLPPGMDLQSWSPALDPAVMRAFTAAFQGQWGMPGMTPDLWRDFFTGVPQFRPELSCLALAGGEVVGFCINWVVDNNAWVEALGVLPDWRGRGLASALLSHSLVLFQAAGFTRAALDVDAENPTGALRLYQKLGFVAVKEEIHYLKQLT